MSITQSTPQAAEHHRKSFVLCWSLALMMSSGSVARGDDEIRRDTYAYKQVGDLEILADVYRMHEWATPQPVVVWIHGGALINGHRESVPQRWLDAFLKPGAVVVSIDYRLAPETQLPEIISDVEDAIAWIRNDGPALFNANPEKIVVMGGSAGGYLTLVTGHRVDPPPQALVAFWGYGDLVGPWYSEPSPHSRHHQSMLTREEAYAQVDGPPISDARERDGDGGAFYQYCRQQGDWPLAVSGWDPHTQADEFVPYMPVRNVTADYPATFLVHGTADTDVPYEQSVMMAEQLSEHGVDFELITIEGGEHGLDGGNPETIEAAYRVVRSLVLLRIIE